MNTPKVARYAVIADPMHELCAEDMRVVPEEATFADLIEPGSTWLCQVAGDGMESGPYLPVEHWNTLPLPGDVIVFHRRALGGGNSSRSWLTLAVAIVAAYATAGASAYFSAAYGAGVGAAAGAAAGITTTLVGNALINAIVPLDQSNIAGQQAQQSPTYSTSIQGNRTRLGEPIPVLYGHNNTYPDLPCDPYQEFIENDQYFHAILCVGMGYMDVLRVSIDDTPLDHFSEVEYLVIGPGQADGATLADQTLVKDTIVNSTEVAGNEMLELKIVGPYVAVPREREAIYLGIDVILQRGLGSGLSIEWVVQARSINGFEQPISDWVTLATETYATTSATPMRLSYRYPVAAARYQVRVYRSDIRSTDPNAAHDITWVGLTCEMNEPGIDPAIPATYVVLKMRASQQLNGVSQRRIRVLSNRMLPAWNGSAWSAPAVTRSIAWAAADILRNEDYGRSLDDDQIDLVQLLALDAVWAARFDRYDGVFDTLTDTWSAISQVVRVGRAVPLIRGSRYTFVRDGADLEPVALYGMRNIRKGSFSLQLAVPQRDEIDALDIEYWDQSRWEFVTQTVQYVGASETPPFIAYTGDVAPSPYTRSDNRGNIRMPGIIGPNHCAREGAYRLADMRFRRSRATYRTQLDGLLPAYASPVLIAHDIPSWGQSGDVVDWDSGGSIVTTSEPLNWAGAGHVMRLHSAQGVIEWDVTEGAEVNEAIVADDLGFTPDFDSANTSRRTTYVFGPSTNMGALCRVRAIMPRSERDIEHQVVLEDARVHTADSPWVAADAAISDGSSGPAEGSNVLVVRILNHDLGGTTQGPDGVPVVAYVTYTLGDNGLASWAAGTIGAKDAAVATPGLLANEWLQGGIVDPSVAALYEVEATLIASVSGGGDTFTGTVGADVWQQLGTAAISWGLSITVAPPSSSSRTLALRIRDVATETVQDIATVVLYTDAQII